MEDKAKPQNVSEEEARRVAEAAREKEWDRPSFLRETFLGTCRMDLVHPFPDPKGIDRPEFQEFYQKMKTFMEEEVDSDAIDRNGKIPEENIKKLGEMGAYAMKINKEYGGVGLSQAEYNKVLQMVGSTDGNIAALLSAHQSIGVPQPLILFGTEEQKKKYLTRIAKGEISGFALTESQVGSDPANLATTVTETEDGKAYIMNGEKIWCTNGTIATLLVVMAKHTEDGEMSAFIVEMAWKGVEVVQRCHFMGLRALENGVIRFDNVRVPKENLLWKRGNGLKLALITLNTGRLTIPASCVGAAKACLEVCRTWGNERVQWGQAIGKHEAIAQKIADIAATTFAMESITDLATALADHGLDIRLEAAVAKMFNSEAGWKIIDDTLQIRSGRGYETADSLKERGEPGIAIERAMRDFRINMIFEGSSEIMRLFIAREAVDKHLEVAGALIDPKKKMGEKLSALPGIAKFYLKWYPGLWFAWDRWPRYGEFGKLSKHVRFLHRATRKLAREIYHGMLVYRAAMQRKQAFLFRVVDIGAELYAMSATISRAKKLAKEGNREAEVLADIFCSNSQRRVRQYFKDLWSNKDKKKYKLARGILDEKYLWLEEGIVESALGGTSAAAEKSSDSEAPEKGAVNSKPEEKEAVGEVS